MNKLRVKLQSRLDALTTAMEEQKHLQDGQELLEVMVLIASITKFWRILSDSERDFINAARFAIEEQIFWK